MGLTGLEIYKQLPKKNCGECGHPTCLAFAMSLANGKANLEACPYVSEEAREALDSAAAPPIAKIIVGRDENAYELGDETELFRHDRKFYHETAVALELKDTLSKEELENCLQKIKGLKFTRVGLEYKVQFIAVKNETDEVDVFAKTVEYVAGKTKLPLVLLSENPAAMEQALKIAGKDKPLIYAANEENFEKMTALAQENDCPLAVKAEGLGELAELVEKITKAGHKQLVLDPGSRSISRAIADFTQIRRLAIKKKFRPFGYPIISFCTETDPLAEINQAVAYISKYASIVVLKTLEKEHLLPLLTWRQNLYTDPQVPIRVEEKLNEIGEVNENSPVYVTTNFSLTYYSVEGEVGASRIPSYIISVDTDGLSVLTAYADGKFEADKIAKVIKKVGVEEKVKHRNIVIPGGVAVLKGKLEEESGWNVLVGPREASGIPSYAKSKFA